MYIGEILEKLQLIEPKTHAIMRITGFNPMSKNMPRNEHQKTACGICRRWKNFKYSATGCHFTGPIALRHKLSLILLRLSRGFNVVKYNRLFSKKQHHFLKNMKISRFFFCE